VIADLVLIDENAYFGSLPFAPNVPCSLVFDGPFSP